MDKQEIEKFMRNSFSNGETVESVETELENRGVSQEKIENAVNDMMNRLKGANMSKAREDLLKKIDLTDDKYTVKQSLIRNKYEVTNSRGDVVLKAKQKLFKMKDEFPFTDPEGNLVFTVKAKKRLDIAGDYGIIDAETDEKIGVLNKKFTLLKHVWRLRDPATDEEIAKIESRSAFIELLRQLSDILSFLPHKYQITDSEGNEIGRIHGKFSLKDTYEIEVDDIDEKEVVIAASIAIDALEGN